MNVLTLPHVARHYTRLAMIPRPGDAANLHVPGRDRVDDALLEVASSTSPEHWLRAQVFPLWFDDEGSYERAAMADASPLVRLLGQGLRAPHDAPDPHPLAAPLPLPEQAQSALLATRGALYERVSEAPELRIVHAPALSYVHRGVHFTRGRATRNARGAHVVAVSLDANPMQVVIQILHEETHPVTDPAIRARFTGVTQRTDGKGDGGALHLELERVVVAVDAAIIEARAPALLDAYATWCAQFSL